MPLSTASRKQLKPQATAALPHVIVEAYAGTGKTFTQIVGVAWAFGNVHGEKTYWHPLTWISHMLDVQWFGLNAGAHHLVNVFWHALNVALLFIVLLKLTGAPWRSAAVAALFAFHPLQVDTVAWITERKNLLSTFFCSNQGFEFHR